MLDFNVQLSFASSTFAGVSTPRQMQQAITNIPVAFADFVSSRVLVSNLLKYVVREKVNMCLLKK